MTQNSTPKTNRPVWSEDMLLEAVPQEGQQKPTQKTRPANQFVESHSGDSDDSARDATDGAASKNHYDLSDIKARSHNQWNWLLPRLSDISSASLDGRHHPCPKCGGSDRFRALDLSVGGLYCNQCFSDKNYDGIAALCWLNGWDYQTTITALAKELGVLPSALPESVAQSRKNTDPARDLTFREASNPTTSLMWAKKKPGINHKVAELAGLRQATYKTPKSKSSKSVITFPIFDLKTGIISGTNSGTSPKTKTTPQKHHTPHICGWAMYAQDGGTLPVFTGKGKPPEQVKIKTTFGSGKGLLNQHAVTILAESLTNPELRSRIKLVWKAEGVSDALALFSLIPESLRDQHLVITNSGGAKERPDAWVCELLAGLPVNVIHDCDIPGQEGAMLQARKDGAPPRLGWAPILSAHCSAVRNVVLPFLIQDSHGADLRDWINQGHTYQELLDLAGTFPLVDPQEFQEQKQTEQKQAEKGKPEDQSLENGTQPGKVTAAPPSPTVPQSPSASSSTPKPPPSPQPPTYSDDDTITNAIIDSKDNIKPLPMTVIVARINRLCSNWPRRVASLLFHHNEGTDDPVRWLDRSASLFAFLSEQTGRPPLLYRTPGCHTKDEIYASLEYAGKQYRGIETTPHEPPFPDHYYAHAPVTPGDGDTLNELLGMFSPETPIDYDLIKAMLATTIWGGPGGSRPMFIITSRDGRGVGKTTLANIVAEISGGPFAISAGQDREAIIKRLLSSEGLARRVAILDNLKTHRFSWADLEDLITCREISGHKMYQGEGSRLNTLTWLVTLNGVSLSTDMAQRAVIIYIKRPEHSGNWLRDLKKFVLENRKKILADLVAFLREEPFGLASHSRWGLWEDEILARLPDPSEAQKVIAERRGVTDVETEETEIFQDYIWEIISGLGIDRSDRVFLPSYLISDWFGKATKEKHSTTSVTRILKQKIEEGNMPYMVVNKCKTWGRGFIFKMDADWGHSIGTEHSANGDDHVVTDIEARIERKDDHGKWF